MQYKKIKTPVKIGDETRVKTYAASLINGEEQLLVTRDGRLFLTDGKGSFLSFKTNSSYTINEIDAKIKTLNDTDSAIETDLTNTKNDLSSFKQSTNECISIIDQELTKHDNDINDIKTDIDNINNSNIPASKIIVDVPILGVTQKISLQDVINNLLVSVGGYIMPTIIGETECGTTECGA